MSNGSKTHSLSDIQKITGGAIDGDGNCAIATLAPSNEPNSSAITYMVGKHVDPKKAASFGAVIVNKAGAAKIRASNAESPLLIVEEPQKTFLKLIDSFSPRIHPKDMFVGNHGNISSDAQIGKGVVIHPNVVIYPNVKIGARTIIYAGVIIREDTVIGEDCIIHPNVVIGADGFGYVPDSTEGLKAVPQVGNVKIGNKVHIGANTTIDRAALGSTVIGDGTKIDNQVQIGHNVQIGKFCLICGQVGIAGSCTIADGVILAGKVGVADHVKIVSGVRVGAGSHVLFDLLEPGDYAGSPAIKAFQNKRNNVELNRLSQTVSSLKKQLAR